MRGLLAFAFAAIAALVLGGARAHADDTYRWNIPSVIPAPLVPADNAMTEAKVNLGRFLFYDKRLSANGTISCASCHRQAYAFSDPRVVPVGVTGQKHPRHAMRLVNVAYLPVLTWANPNQRALESQALVPMFGEHPVEMGLGGREKQMLAMLKADVRYQRLFAEAFPDQYDQISLATVTRAISSFERALLSFDSPYDQYRYGHHPDAISAAAKRGEGLFFGERIDCAHCHGGINFTDNIAHVRLRAPEIAFHNTALYNIGGTGAYPHDNRGIEEITENPADMGKFRTPSLRNIAAGGPFMHDGSVKSLEEAIDHYAAGGRTIAAGPYAGDGSKSPLRDTQLRGFKITPQERSDLVAFLQSLTDDKFLHDPRFSDPFAAEAK
ncbi:MAG TPA: MbnH family di-heme enzyme [Candidatus Elarobacter sp.]|nr:MbnH family di-heme enzyme [Candidatus Elarobacter sp.]